MTKLPFAGEWAGIDCCALSRFLRGILVEALTIVPGSERHPAAGGLLRAGRRSLSLSLSFLVLALGSAVNLAPLSVGLFQFLFGLALLLFGMRWLRKSSLRAAGALPLRDEAAVFATEITHLKGQAKPRSFDWMGFVTAFQWRFNRRRRSSFVS